LKAIEIEWVAWRFNQKNSMLGGESILQIQSNSWFTGAQLLACDDDWAMVLPLKPKDLTLGTLSPKTSFRIERHHLGF
jgi:hypothetical protein